MIWNNFVSRLAVASRRNALATAVVYGLSLAVRFTSTAGEEVEIPPSSVQQTMSAISIMAGARAQHQDWARPIVFHCGWPLVRQTAAPACEPSLPMLTQGSLGS
jgi:hypothetical protein